MPNVVLLDGSERIEVGDPLNPANWKMPKSCIEVRREASRKCVEIGSWWPVHGFYLASSQSRRDAPLRADWPRSITPSNWRSGIVHNNKPGSKWKERFGPAVSYTHLRAHETDSYLVCRLLLEKKK